MNIVIINYGLGNLFSVTGAVEKLGYTPVVSSDIEVIAAADKLLLPGVGAFGDGMRNLRKLGLIVPLNRIVLDEGKPILGICLGAQLMAKESYEFGHHQGLGWINATINRIEPQDSSLRVPHVGWNDLIQLREDALFEGIPSQALFYYVHSYHIQSHRQDIIIGETDYGQRITAVIHQDNIYLTQFHPEKSQMSGLTLLNNFLKIEYGPRPDSIMAEPLIKACGK